MVSTLETKTNKDFKLINKGLVLNPKSNLSIVIPSYNSIFTITKLLDSIKESKQQPYEVILVDDFSTDNSLNIVLENFSWVQILRLNKNSGPACARNLGVENAKKEIIFFLDSDVILTPNAIKFIEERHINHPKIAGLQGRYHWSAANPGIFSNYKALINHFWYLNNKKEREVNFLVTYACTIKKSIFLEMGGFSEAYKKAEVEDYELGYRIAKKHTLLHEPNLEVYHHFPSFFKNSKNYTERGSQWFDLFIKNKRFDKSGATTVGQAISRLFGGLSFCSILLTLFNKSFLNILLLTTLTYLILNLRFFIFCFQKRGITYFFLSIFFHYVSSVIICFTMFSSLIKHILKFKKGGGIN